MYRHDFAIRHMPKFVWGVSLLTITTIAVILNVIDITSDEWQYDPAQIFITLINVMGMGLGVISIDQGVKYTATEIPEDELSEDEKLKRDLKG